MLQVQGCYGLEYFSSVGAGVSSSSLGKKSQDAAAANKHALAERHRRKRINNHLNTLRKLFPNLPKSDKPRVLMETVRYLKELRKKMADDVEMGNDDEGWCIKGRNGKCLLFLPSEKDEVNVSYCEGGGDEHDDQTRLMMVKAMICCEDRPRLNRDLTQAVQSAKGKVVKAEMCTVGGRTKAALVVQWCGEGGGGGEEEVGLLRKALKAVVENRALLGPKMLSPRWTGLGLGRPISNASISDGLPLSTDGLLSDSL